jgi:hypothetical protein
VSAKPETLRKDQAPLFASHFKIAAALALAAAEAAPDGGYINVNRAYLVCRKNAAFADLARELGAHLLGFDPYRGGYALAFGPVWLGSRNRREVAMEVLAEELRARGYEIYLHKALD